MPFYPILYPILYSSRSLFPILYSFLGRLYRSISLSFSFLSRLYRSIYPIYILLGRLILSYRFLDRSCLSSESCMHNIIQKTFWHQNDSGKFGCMELVWNYMKYAHTRYCSLWAYAKLLWYVCIPYMALDRYGYTALFKIHDVFVYLY